MALLLVRAQGHALLVASQRSHPSRHGGPHREKPLLAPAQGNSHGSAGLKPLVAAVSGPRGERRTAGVQFYEPVGMALAVISAENSLHGLGLCPGGWDQ